VRKNVGEGTVLEQLTANVQKTQAQNSVEISANELKIAVNELQLLLGTPKNEMMNELMLLDSIVFKPNQFSLEELYQMAMASNILLKSGSIRRDIASKEYSLAWSSLLPSFSASYFRQSQNGNAGLYGVSLGVSIPLWFLFDQRGQIQTAAATSTIAEHEFVLLQNSIAVAVKTAYYEMVNNERQVSLYRTEILPQAAEILRSAQASYDAGDITYLEFLQARQTAVQAKASYIDVQFSYHVSMAKLEQIIGRPLDN
jgi:outer membrane protein TolC